MFLGCSVGLQQLGFGLSVVVFGVGLVGSGKVFSDFFKDVLFVVGDVVIGVLMGLGDKEIWIVDIKVVDVNVIDGIQFQLNVVGFLMEVGVIEKIDMGVGGEFNGFKYDVFVEIVKGDNGWVVDYFVIVVVNQCLGVVGVDGIFIVGCLKLVIY